MRQLEHIFFSRFVFIGNDAVENRILDRSLQLTHDRAGFKMKNLHDLIAFDRRLEITNPVSLLQLHHLLSYQLIVPMESGFFLLVTTRDIRIAEQHQILYIISGFEEQTAYRTVRDKLHNFGFGLEKMPAGVTAAGGILMYLEPQLSTHLLLRSRRAYRGGRG